MRESKTAFSVLCSSRDGFPIKRSGNIRTVVRIVRIYFRPLVEIISLDSNFNALKLPSTSQPIRWS
jgi:hypothetical protein